MFDADAAAEEWNVLCLGDLMSHIRGFISMSSGCDRIARVCVFVFGVLGFICSSIHTNIHKNNELIYLYLNTFVACLSHTDHMEFGVQQTRREHNTDLYMYIVHNNVCRPSRSQSSRGSRVYATDTVFSAMAAGAGAALACE